MKNSSNKNLQKVNLTSSNLSEEKLAELYRILPEAFAENKIDFDKLRIVLGDSIVQGSDKFSFSWAGKSNAIKNVLVPSHLTLNPVPGESVKWDESENLFIEGDNLEVLKLLQKAYFEKVKMIYIDPPYNTGHDFVYNDDFSAPLDNYLKQTGQRNGDGHNTTTNNETSGRYHSDWLSMMYPRLKLAWNLLRNDGVIFVSIDDNEVHHLRIVMDEIFGEENFLSEIIWQRTFASKNDAKFFSVEHEYILVYAKDINKTAINLIPRGETQIARYQNPDNDPRGPWTSTDLLRMEHRENSVYSITSPTGKVWTPDSGTSWRHPESEMLHMIANNEVVFGSDGNAKPRRKRFLKDVKDGVVPMTIWKHDEVGHTQEAKQHLIKLFDGARTFDTPKPIRLVKRMLEIATKKDAEDIVLDFFGGSGTTAHAVLNQNAEDGGNRKFIIVQLQEKFAPDSDAGRAGYKTISEVSRARIRLAIKGLNERLDSTGLGFKAFTLTESNYPENNFVLDPEKSSEENQKEFVAYLQKAKQKKLFSKDDDMSLVYENVVKEGLSLNSKVEKISIGKNNVYQVTDGDQQLLVCLEDKLAPETVKELTDKAHKDRIFICLEISLDDTIAANLALNLDLKTI